MQLSRALLLAVGLFEAVLECRAVSAGRSESVTTQTPGNYDEIADHYCPGGRIDQIEGLSVDGCKLHCDADPTCVAFVRFHDSGRCNFKAAANCDKTVIMQPHASRTVYWKDGELDGTVNAALAGLPSAGPAAVGDPHLVNILGQRFDIYQPGSHTLIQVPKGTAPGGTLLRVDALAAKLGGACGDLYFTALNMTGQWANKGLGLRFFAGREPRPSGSWQRFGQVSMKVKAGRTAGGIDYLNIYTRDLSRVGFPVGGLLGDDDHTAASSTTAGCRAKMSLSEGA